MTIRNVLRAGALAYLLVGSFVFPGCAQDSYSITDGRTPREVPAASPAGSYHLSDIDNVDLYSGTLSMNIPLLTVEGRGEGGYTISLPLERHWMVQGRPTFVANEYGAPVYDFLTENSPDY